MNLKELVGKVSGSTGVAADTVQKVLDATISAINKGEGDQPIKLNGLGTFARKTPKKGGDEKIVFKPWLTKDQKQAKKALRKEKKAKKQAKAPAGQE